MERCPFCQKRHRSAGRGISRQRLRCMGKRKQHLLKLIAHHDDEIVRLRSMILACDDYAYR